MPLAELPVQDHRRPIQDPPRSVGRVLSVLETVADRRDGISLSELALLVDTPKSSLLNMLKGLVASQHLTVLNQRYRLGGAAYRMAHAMLASRPSMSPVLHEAIEELLERTGETAVLTRLDPESMTVTYIEGVDSRQTVRYSVSLGSSRPLYCTAAGQAILAYEEPATQERYIAQTEFLQLTPNTLTDPDRLRAKLARIRSDGYAVSIQEGIFGAVGIAAALPGNDDLDRRRIALLVAGPTGRLDKRIEEVSRVLTEVAEKTAGMLRFAR
ncbi:IclR family transcriptional regulator [Sphingomonas azotifigens]|uniref:IclR family transcriptional regulator n=1 Tax=Sphingomonas azotifigens TaxID=330920 RepID=UPI000A0226FB